MQEFRVRFGLTNLSLGNMEAVLNGFLNEPSIHLSNAQLMNDDKLSGFGAKPGLNFDGALRVSFCINNIQLHA